MTEYYIFIVGLLALLAISDLIVGVSNDAVNFLNSAVGSKVAPRHIIMIVASLGIFIGATFSSGMMEVARKGIFFPDAFYFTEIMVIFIAVMLTDIFLLDMFNTFGLPTSTTVSIVFELLGAAVVVALLKMSDAGEGIGHLATYINSSSALAIITSILASVIVAFIMGILLQYLSRLLFTFHYEKRMKWVGGIWAGLALTFLTYFLLFKGVKGASFVSTEFVTWVGDNIMKLMLLSFVFWSVVLQILISVFKVNILRIVVLFGTFSLAMAFAGNDLVNFIGVPMAGYESYKIWSSSGVDASQLTMEALNNPVKANTLLLLLAGLVMVVTLWISKKARTVTDTEVDLGRQDEGLETFSSNALSRGIVRQARALGKTLETIVPLSLQHWLNKSFIPAETTAGPGQPAFDLVRASVNLTAASILIAFATSLKLPLSTTYVSFMVAMGTSFADRAWGSDSAVYRIAGVLNVIGGWFVTAIIAFSVAGLIALLVHTFGVWAITVLVAILVYIIYKTHIIHRIKKKEKDGMVEFEQQVTSIAASYLVESTSERVATTLKLINSTYQKAISGLLEEKLDLIEKAKGDLRELKKENDKLKKRLFRGIQRIEEKDTEASTLFVRMYDLQMDIIDSAGFVVKTCAEHVENSLKPLKPEQAEAMTQLKKAVNEYIDSIIDILKEKNFHDLDAIFEKQKTVRVILDAILANQISGIKKGEYGKRNSLLIFSIKLETKDIVTVGQKFIRLYHKALKELRN